ncbi:nucleotidyl transferase AbiEii/AbiGii toxin family protein [Candidatus Woesearchaeota archaeon]|nr:nucleotidyl transferase AbiEii/AbiGii toxin family protein [Candidatus Woesearchaeota archaeon]
MAEIKRITIDDLKDIADRQKFNELLLIKDYYLTQILYLIRDIKGLYFKGGTAFQKIFFNHMRLSEDIDLTSTKDVQAVINEVETALNNSGLFEKITKDKDVEGFTRLVVNYKIAD